MVNRILLFTLVALCISFAEMIDNIPDNLLNRAISEFNKGNYRNVLFTLEDSLIQIPGEQKYIAHLYIGLSYAYLEDNEGAKDNFKKVLKINPSFKLVSDVVTPKVIDLFAIAKKEIANESAFCSCFIPGIGQMLKGEEKKGKFIMLSASVSLAGSIYSWLITTNRHTDYLSLGPDDTDKMDEYYNKYNSWYKISLTSSFIFATIYIYSFLDALLINNEIKIRSNSTPYDNFMKDKKDFKLAYHINF